MRISSMLPAGLPKPACGPRPPQGARLFCPNPGCGGDLECLDGAEDLYCAACSAVVVILRDDVAVWLCRHAEPQRCSAGALQYPPTAC